METLIPIEYIRTFTPFDESEPPLKVAIREVEEEVTKLPIVDCQKVEAPTPPPELKPVTVNCQKASKNIQYCPTVPCLYFIEELYLRAAKSGLTISQANIKRKRKRSQIPLTFAMYPWFYEMKENKPCGLTKSLKLVKQLKLSTSKRMLLHAHQSAVLKMRKLVEMYEVEYIADFRMIEEERFYLVKWVGWPEEANTWESSRNLSCHLLINEFHQDFQDQLMMFFVRNKTSWAKIFLNSNGFGRKHYTQRLYDLLPKRFKYRSSYGEIKMEFRNALKRWQDKINFFSKGKPFLAVENEVDLDLPPENFTYISRNIAGRGVTIPNDPFIWCNCAGNCGLPSSKCTCVGNGGGKLQKPPYENNLIKVRPGRPIYECNSKCQCGKNCPTRVVQKGSKYPLGIFRTPTGKGWGVKALQPIPKGAFVVEYVGEVITNTEAERRGLEYDTEGVTYLFDLDYHETDNLMTVDATRFGNVSHFINHSCSPNLQVYNVFIDNMDLSLPRIALFARKNIQVNEELSFDYQMTGASGDYQEEDTSDKDSDKSNEAGESTEGSDRQSEVSDSSETSSTLKIKCLCNASNCRGWLIV